MSDRICEVWGRGTAYWVRLFDLIRYGHERHVCARLRPFGIRHEGPHRCRCGQEFAQLFTDDR